MRKHVKMKQRGGRGGENRRAKYLRKIWQQRKRELTADERKMSAKND